MVAPSLKAVMICPNCRRSMSSLLWRDAITAAGDKDHVPCSCGKVGQWRLGLDQKTQNHEKENA